MVEAEELGEKLGKIEDDIVLVLISSEDYTETILSILEYEVEEEGNTGIYVTVNKPYTSIVDRLEGSGVDVTDIFFIDAISKEAEPNIEDADNVLFLDSPQDLTDLSISISQVTEKLGEEKKFLMMDSISTLAIYNSLDVVSRFSHFLINRMRNWNVSGVVLALKEDADDDVVKRLKQFCDRTIKV